MTPEKQFKEFQKQLAKEPGVDDFHFTGDVEAALAMFESDGIDVVLQQSEPYYVYYADDSNYWGSGPTKEMALRYVIGAVLDTTEED